MGTSQRAAWRSWIRARRAGIRTRGLPKLEGLSARAARSNALQKAVFRCSEHAILTEAMYVGKKRDCGIAVPYGNATIVLFFYVHGLCEAGVFRKSRRAGNEPIVTRLGQLGAHLARQTDRQFYSGLRTATPTTFFHAAPASVRTRARVRACHMTHK